MKTWDVDFSDNERARKKTKFGDWGGEVVNHGIHGKLGA